MSVREKTRKGGNARLKGMVLIVLILCLCGAPLVVTARDTVHSITVSLTDPAKNEGISGAEVAFYRVAAFADDEAVRTHTVTAQDAYAPLLSTLDLSTTEKGDTPENAAAILAWIDQKSLAAAYTARSDASGQVTFANAAEGVYLVRVSTGTEWQVKPFLMEVPLYEAGALREQVVASPKVSWSLTTVSDGGTPTGPQDTLIPQTGRAKWPVPVLFVLGVTLVVAGYVDHCFREKRHSGS